MMIETLHSVPFFGNPQYLATDLTNTPMDKLEYIERLFDCLFVVIYRIITCFLNTELQSAVVPDIAFQTLLTLTHLHSCWPEASWVCAAV